MTQTRHTLTGFLTGTSNAHTQGHHEQNTTHTAAAARRGIEHPPNRCRSRHLQIHRQRDSQLRTRGWCGLGSSSGRVSSKCGGMYIVGRRMRRYEGSLLLWQTGIIKRSSFYRFSGTGPRAACHGRLTHTPIPLDLGPQENLGSVRRAAGP